MNHRHTLNLTEVNHLKSIKVLRGDTVIDDFVSFYQANFETKDMLHKFLVFLVLLVIIMNVNYVRWKIISTYFVYASSYKFISFV